MLRRVEDPTMGAGPAHVERLRNLLDGDVFSPHGTHPRPQCCEQLAGLGVPAVQMPANEAPSSNVWASATV